MFNDDRKKAFKFGYCKSNKHRFKEKRKKRYSVSENYSCYVLVDR